VKFILKRRASAALVWALIIIAAIRFRRTTRNPQARSQTANKQTALRILKSRLAERQEEERDAELAKERGVVSMGFGGNAIRSYVLHPYQLVKDHRTDYEMGNTQGVLDGDLEGFIQAYLLAKAAGKVV